MFEWLKLVLSEPTGSNTGLASLRLANSVALSEACWSESTLFVIWKDSDVS
jgi:hypothetical protein